MNLRLLTLVAASVMAATMCNAQQWTDVTERYMTNPAFDNNSIEGWTLESPGGTVGPSAECMRFYNTTCTLSQQLVNLPKGNYKLSLQGFYRTSGDGYAAFSDGSENITAFLFAGDKTVQLVSVYSESIDEWGNGDWQQYDGRYFPNNSMSAADAFQRGLYQKNVVEFTAQGNVTIGLRCSEREIGNYCVFDNFKLEYNGDVPQVSSVSLSAPVTELIAGETVTVTPVLEPNTGFATTLNWSSSDTKVATVDRRGVVTAVGRGTAVITAAVAGNTAVKGTIGLTVITAAATAGSLVINEVMAANIDEYISPAFNFDGWIELYNPTDKAVELNGLRIRDVANEEGPWTMPGNMGGVPAKGYRLVWFDSNSINPRNAPFKLDTDGGSIVITDAAGTEICSQSYPAAIGRTSYARLTDGTGEWGNTATPTPGASNNGIAHQQQQLAAPVVDQPSQLFDDKLSVRVTIPAGCTLRYTTDGTLPTLKNGETSKNGRFTIDYTTNYRFRLFADGQLPSPVTTRSYIFRDFEYYLPVVSVVTDPDFIYSSEIGVFEQGPNGKPGNGQAQKCNWNMDWERPVNFSYLDQEGTMVLNQDANLEMCGGWSRAWQPKAFKLKGNKELSGDKNLPYPFFDQKPYIRNRTLQIRNGGNDYNCRFRDPALQYIVQSSRLNIDCQSYQPVHEFINGEYMGVLNVREPNNKHYVYANYGWDEDEIDQFEMSPDSNYIQKCGTPDAFNELVDVLAPDAANSDTYAEICRLLDIDAYINYMAIELYLGNWDWPQNNVKGFRHRDGGRFRFVLFDVDGSFNTSNQFNDFMNKERYDFDPLYPATLKRHVNEQIRFVTLFKNLLKNADFCRRFVDAYCIIGGSVYEKTRAAAILDSLYQSVEPAMNIPVYSRSWWGESAYGTYSQVRSALSTRNTGATNALKNFSPFGLRNTAKQMVTLDTDTPGATLFINSQEVPTSRFDGALFAPVTLRAQAPAGYRFSGWTNSKTGALVSKDAETALPAGNVQLTATFVPMSNRELAEGGITPIRINEVSGANDSYIDEYGKKGDWIELYNTTDKPVDVEGMYLTDNLETPTKHQITKGATKAATVIPPHGYLIVWCDNNRATTDRGLHASFKISGDGGLVAITAGDQSWQDVIAYGRHDATTTVARYPDGSNSVYHTNVPTMARSNIFTSYMTADQSATPTAIAAAEAANPLLRLVYASRRLLVHGARGRSVALTVSRADGHMAAQAELPLAHAGATLDVSSLPPGLYVARATTDDGATTATCKFVVR